MNADLDYGLLNTQQDPRFGDRKYGRLGTIAKNGCGLIALYNVERAARPETRFDPFYDARKPIKTTLFGLLGTRPSSIRKNLARKGFIVTDIDRKHPEGNASHDAVIVLYWYWFGAHYVAGFADGNGAYTMYNYFSTPYAQPLENFLRTVRGHKNRVVHIWGVDFPPKDVQTDRISSDSVQIGA
jgi:hypothetical protein